MTAQAPRIGQYFPIDHGSACSLKLLVDAAYLTGLPRVAHFGKKILMQRDYTPMWKKYPLLRAPLPILTKLLK